MRVLGIDRELLLLGVASTEHASYDKDGHLLGIYGPNDEVRASAEFKMVESKVSNVGFSSSDESDSGAAEAVAEGNVPPGSRSMKRRRHNVHISRQQLRQLMLEKVDPHRIEWGHKLTDCIASKDSSQQMTLKFDNAKEAKADVVVAADGINSALRRLLFPNQRLNYLGLIVILGISNRPEGEALEGEEGSVKYRKVQWVDGCTRVFSMPFDKEKIMWQVIR